MPSGRKYYIYPKTILIATFILIFLFTGFAIYEYIKSRKDLMTIMEEEGYVLLETLTASSQRSILAYEELEQQIQNQLRSDAVYLDAIDKQTDLDHSDIEKLNNQLNLFLIQFYSAAGELIVEKSSPSFPIFASENEKKNETVLSPVFSGETDTLIIGFHYIGSRSEPVYSVALKRKNNETIVVGIASQKLLSFNRELGPGKLIQEFGNKQGIDYVVLQDTSGILMASRGVLEMSRIQDDDFLYQNFTKKSMDSRITSFRGENNKVFEIVGPFLMDDTHLGLYRIGLNMTHYETILRNYKIRLFLISLILIVAGIISLGLIVSNQNIRLLSESYERVQTHTGEILQNMGDGVVAVDHQLKVTVYNRAVEQLFGIPKEKILGKQIHNLNFPLAWAILESYENRKPVERMQDALEVQNIRKDISFRTSLVINQDNLTEAVILVTTDLTLQKQLEKKLHQQQKLTAMGKLASGVAHEIRNPINAIGMIAQRLLKEFTPEKDKFEYKHLTQTIVEETRRTDAIIKRFLEFSKPKPLSKESVLLPEFLREIYHLFASSAHEKGVKFFLRADSKTNVSIDVDQMKQVVLNLLQNALDAVGKKDTIELSTRVFDSDFEISVRDTGCGMDDEMKKKIFDLYFTTKNNGTGMGLPIAYQIVQSHGGDLTVQSETGSGSVFRIRLPKGDV